MGNYLAVVVVVVVEYCYGYMFEVWECLDSENRESEALPFVLPAEVVGT